MRKVYAPCPKLPEERFQFLCVFYMPTVNCRPSYIPSFQVFFLFEAGGRSEEAQRPEARKCCCWSFLSFCHFGVYKPGLRKFHVRNRHKSYGHILNLCASCPAKCRGNNLRHPSHDLHSQFPVPSPSPSPFCGWVLRLRLVSLASGGGDLISIFVAALIEFVGPKVF